MKTYQTPADELLMLANGDAGLLAERLAAKIEECAKLEREVARLLADRLAAIAANDDE